MTVPFRRLWCRPKRPLMPMSGQGRGRLILRLSAGGTARGTLVANRMTGRQPNTLDAESRRASDCYLSSMSPLPRLVQDLTNTFLHEVDDRLRDRLSGLFLHGSLCWGEFFEDSDVDFVTVWDVLPIGADLDLLGDAHRATKERFPSLVFDGFHCTADDLRSDPSNIESRPTFYRGEFDPAGGIDINPVTWHELAERPVIVRGSLPKIWTDTATLVEFTRTNLDTYWRSHIEPMKEAGAEDVGSLDPTVAWVALGAPRLHHLLSTGSLTSKSGAGRYVMDELDPRWNKLGSEALRIRETPDAPTLYDGHAERGQDLIDLLAWIVEDGTRQR